MIKFRPQRQLTGLSSEQLHADHDRVLALQKASYEREIAAATAAERARWLQAIAPVLAATEGELPGALYVLREFCGLNRIEMLDQQAKTLDWAAEIEKMRRALLTCARQAEALKRECGMDPESAQALRNAQYQAISVTAHIALGTMRGLGLSDGLGAGEQRHER